MSLHKSKGLTSPAVFIVAAVEGILPTIPSDETERMRLSREEGRRLMYVALTRAADELVISSSTRMDLADANARNVRYDRSSIRHSGNRYTVQTLASPYIAELGTDAPASLRGENWLRRRD